LGEWKNSGQCHLGKNMKRGRENDRKCKRKGRKGQEKEKERKGKEREKRESKIVK
jgi:hypothetical protein